MSKLILGIESSCDETAAAVVADGRILLANVIRSSAEIHKAYGGVVPEIASREHVEAIVPVVQTALTHAGLSLSDLAAVAVTAGPGLLGSLLVGVSAAKALAAVAEKPLVPVHHLMGHIAANYLAYPELKPPFLALVVSGGHSHILRVRTYTQVDILARTRDDAPGEAFDKVAREIGIGYPGGPLLDKLSAQGDARRLELPIVQIQGSLDYSFSGLKTAVLNALHQAEQKARKAGLPRETLLSNADIAASFQHAVVTTLRRHVEKALEQEAFSAVVLAGGVSANSDLRQSFRELAKERGLQLYFPPLALCTDNAAMIAAQGFYNLQAGITAGLDLNARAMWEMDESEAGA